jgi:hypothetical protein
MALPLFTGEASLYRTRQPYTGYSGMSGHKATVSVGPAQISGIPANCGAVCYANCGLKDVACVLGNLDCFSLGGPLLIAGCLALKCGYQTVDSIICALGCSPCTACDICTNCHNTEVGWCFCSGEFCGLTGITTPCCDPGSPGYKPDCTTLGCKRPGDICCDCNVPAVCTTPARCKVICGPGGK